MILWLADCFYFRAMKIILIGSAYPLRGGIATFNERFAAFMQSQGHEVVIYNYSLQYPNFLFPGQTQFSSDPAPENLNIKTVINSANPFNWPKVGKMLRREKADLILVRYWLPYFGPCLGTLLRIAKKSGAKIICIADNIIPHEKRIGDGPFTRYFVKPIDGFLTMSRRVLSDLQHFAADKPAVFTPHPLYDNFGHPLPKTEARSKLGLPQDEKILLFFGIIRKYKGLDLLLNAMADERIKQRKIKLIVAGEFYDRKEEYEAIIKEKNLGTQLYLHTQFIPNSEVAHYFSAADCIVQPYRSATQSGITQVGFQFEKPMIVTNVGGLSEFIIDGKMGYICESDAGSIATAIVRFFDEDKAELMAQCIKEEKKKFSWDYFLKSTLDLYKSLRP